jgi:hypothetical protein
MDKKIKLSEMTIVEIRALKELLVETVTLNNYPGGNQELKVLSNNLIVKINDEITNRIKNIE